MLKNYSKQVYCGSRVIEEFEIALMNFLNGKEEGYEMSELQLCEFFGFYYEEKLHDWQKVIFKTKVKLLFGLLSTTVLTPGLNCEMLYNTIQQIVRQPIE